MAGNPAARLSATQDQNESNSWMKDRRAQLQAKEQAEAAGRQAWASSTRTGQNLQAPQPADVRALGSQGWPTPLAAPGNGGSLSSPLQAVSEAFSDFQKGPAIPRPNLAESFIPVVGPGWEAVADLQQGNYGGAAVNGALAASDIFLAGSIVKGIAKGGIQVADIRLHIDRNLGRRSGTRQPRRAPQEGAAAPTRSWDAPSPPPTDQRPAFMSELCESAALGHGDACRPRRPSAAAGSCGRAHPR